MMPPWLPWPTGLNLISGAAEILGGLGILVPGTRRFAGWGLLVFLVVVFPANVHVALLHKGGNDGVKRPLTRLQHVGMTRIEHE